MTTQNTNEVSISDAMCDSEPTNPVLEAIKRRNYEVKNAAKYLARHGLTGSDDELLPNLMSNTACQWIDNNRRAFKEMVRVARADYEAQEAERKALYASYFEDDLLDIYYDAPERWY